MSDKTTIKNITSQEKDPKILSDSDKRQTQDRPGYCVEGGWAERGVRRDFREDKYYPEALKRKDYYFERLDKWSERDRDD